MKRKKAKSSSQSKSIATRSIANVKRAPQWRARVTACDVAREKDGFLRGRADPAFLLAVFDVGAAGAQLVRRTLVRIVIPNAPGIAPLVPPVEMSGKLRGEVGLLLAIALEEDDGHDVERLYAALAEPARFAVWSDAGDLAPRALADVPSFVAPWSPARVRLMFDDVDVSSACRADTFVGASATTFAGERANREVRVHTKSDDGLNDWTLLTEIKVD